MITFDEMNNLTYEYNQHNKKNRHSLIELIQKTTKLSEKKAAKAAKSYCVAITLNLEMLFKKKIIEKYTLEDLFLFYFTNYMIKPESGWSYYSSAIIIQRLKDNNMIKNCSLIDIDSSYEGETRDSVYNKLVSRSQEDDFKCARVCFGRKRSKSHTILVSRDNENRLVVMDTSYRGHSWSKNSFEKWITPKNILWWTEII